METSLVSWDGGEFTSSCGYCKKHGFVSTGITAYCMTAHDYQNLVDRGWRRCGLYLYKPNNRKTCCPLYTIRCDAVNLQLSKSQKKVLRRFNAFLMKNDANISMETSSQANISPSGIGRLLEEGSDVRQSDLQGDGIDEVVLPQTKPRLLSEKEKKFMQSFIPSSAHPVVDSKSDETKNTKPCGNKNHILSNGENSKESTSSSIADDSNKREADDSKPKCKKAKIMRLERRKARMEKKGISVDDIEAKRVVNKEKTLEDYINEVIPENSARKLETTLVRSVSNASTHSECFKLYEKYQKIIHNDPYNSFDGYKRFLMDSPLNEIKCETDSESPPCGYGTFHQMYWVDGKLVAVGVLDILPRCVSSVYFFYDPDYMRLNLGTYGALKELELTRKLAEKCPSLNQYYLGYYIHSCQKMRYKGQWKPSYLLCPEAYTWHPISECLSKLEVSPYSRLNADVNARSEEDDVDFGTVKLSRGYQYPTTSIRDYDKIDERLESIAGEFARLVGRSAAQKILLYYPEDVEYLDWDPSHSNDSD